MQLKTDIWVKALIRRCEIHGAVAMVVHKGDETAGAALVKVNRLDGRAMLFDATRDLEGERLWIRPLGETFVQEEDVDAHIRRARERDPDLWVVEIEDRAGRHFLTEKVE